MKQGAGGEGGFTVRLATRQRGGGQGMRELAGLAFMSLVLAVGVVLVLWAVTG